MLKSEVHFKFYSLCYASNWHLKFIITLGICKGHGLKLIPCSQKSLLTRVLALPSKLALALKELSLQTMVIILGFIRACVIIGTLSQTKEVKIHPTTGPSCPALVDGINPVTWLWGSVGSGGFRGNPEELNMCMITGRFHGGDYKLSCLPVQFSHSVTSDSLPPHEL